MSRHLANTTERSVPGGDTALCQITLISGVTMGWLLRLVTGAPLVVGGPRQFYFILNQREPGP